MGTDAADPPGTVPGVSVVIPAYNYAHFLPFAIESALQQTHPRVEVIVVDDGSKDNTREVAARYGDRIRYLHQTNAGLPAARNTGITAATHPFVGFLDADDLWQPEMLVRGLATFARMGPEFAIVGCRAHLIDAAGAPLGVDRSQNEFEGEITARDILLRSRFPPSTALVRRAAFAECGLFDVTLTSSEDRDMWIRIAMRHRVYLQGGRFASIRRHGANMSSHGDRMKANMGRVIRKAWANRLAPHSSLPFWLQVMAVYRFQTSLIYHGHGRSADALRDLLASLLYWPLPMAPHRLNSAVSLLRLRTLYRVLQAFGKPRAE